MPSIKTIEQQQLRAQLNRASALPWPAAPRAGWIRVMRKALGMSGAALSARLGGARNRAANLERAEQNGAITVRSLQDAAEAMGCRFVYAIVTAHGEPVETLLEAQAARQAQRLLDAAGGHMALEAQSLSAAVQAAEKERLQAELLAKPPRDFWHPEAD